MLTPIRLQTMSSKTFTRPVNVMPLRKFISREVGNKIKTIRLALKMSQEQFGKQAGNYSQDSVTKWEAGQVPHALVLKRISEISDPPCSVDWILDVRPHLAEEQNLSKRARCNGIRKRRNMMATENSNASTVRGGESWQSPENVENERIFGQIVFDALRQLIREEVDAALKRARSTDATKNTTR